MRVKKRVLKIILFYLVHWLYLSQNNFVTKLIVAAVEFQATPKDKNDFSPSMLLTSNASKQIDSFFEKSNSPSISSRFSWIWCMKNQTSSAIFIFVFQFFRVFGLGDEAATILFPFWNIPSESEIGNAQYLMALPTIAELNEDLERSKKIINRLRHYEFFKRYRVDLDAECPFWVMEKMCTREDACSVCECNEEEIPSPWKMKPLEAFVDRSLESINVQNHQHSFIENPSFKITEGAILKKGTYVDLHLNSPSFTGYRGLPIWQQIYSENCLNEFDENTTENISQCSESAVFYSIISGMHSGIAALSSEFYYQPKKSGDFSTDRPAADPASNTRYSFSFFREKLSDHPERLANLYFLFSLMLRTVCQLEPILEECSCETGNKTNDLAARADLLSLLNQSYHSCSRRFLETPLFFSRYEEAERRLQNITRILDCIQCEKCRLHGKLKMSALQVALKAASSIPQIYVLERNEVTALINSLAYLTDSLSVYHRFVSRLFWLRVQFLVFLFIFSITVGLICSPLIRKRLQRQFLLKMTQILPIPLIARFLSEHPKTQQHLKEY